MSLFMCNISDIFHFFLEQAQISKNYNSMSKITHKDKSNIYIANLNSVTACLIAKCKIYYSLALLNMTKV